MRFVENAHRVWHATLRDGIDRLEQFSQSIVSLVTDHAVERSLSDIRLDFACDVLEDAMDHTGRGASVGRVVDPTVGGVSDTILEQSRVE